LAQGKLQSAQAVCKASIVSLWPRSDGKALLIADSAGNVHEWDLVAQRALHTWPTRQAGLRCARYSPDEKRALTTGALPPTVKEWDLASGRELISITGKMHFFNEGIYGPDGKTALVDGSAGSDPVAAHYDLATGNLLKEWLKNYYTHARSMALSSDGRRVLIGSRTMGTEWQLDGYKLLKTFTGHHGGAVTAVAYCKEPEQLLTGSRDGSIRRWNRLEAKVLLRWCPHEGHVTRLAVSPDGKWALSYGSRRVAETSLATGEPRLKWDRHDGAAQAVAFLPDGGHVVSGSTDGTLRVWDINASATVRVIEGATLGAYAVAVSPDGSRVAAGCKDGVVREFSLKDGSQLRELKGHLGYIRSVAYTHDGARLFSSADDGSIRVWDMKAPESVARLEGHRGGVLATAISLDDKRLASGGRDGTVRLWDLTQPRLLHTLKGHYSWVEAVAFAGDGKHILSAGRDAQLLVWDAESGRLEREIELGGMASALATNANVVYVGVGANIACLDLSTGKKMNELKGHEQAVNGLAISPDGKRLVSASGDTTLLVWSIP
jgi:WD40 repeat protein